MGRAISAAIREISSSSVGDGARLGDDVRSNSDRLISSILARAASGDTARPVMGRAGASINIARGCSALSLARFNARERPMHRYARRWQSSVSDGASRERKRGARPSRARPVQLRFKPLGAPWAASGPRDGSSVSDCGP
jgi:hypothetical protein